MPIDREKLLANAQKYAEKRQYDKAIGELRTVLAKDPNDVRALQKLGEIDMKCGRFADAVDTFETLARLYSEGGFAHKAIAVYKQMHEIIATQIPQLAVRYAHVAPRLAELYRRSGLNREALVVYEQLATNLERSGNFREALGVLQAIVELDRENPLACLRLAEACSHTGEIDGAVASYEMAASLLLQAQRRDDAIAVLERLLAFRADPTNARRCAELYIARGRAPHDGVQALTKLQVCIGVSPGDVEILTLVARAFDLTGERDKALAVRNQLARMPPR